MNKKFKKFIICFSPLFIMIGIATSSIVISNGGLNSFKEKTYKEITKERNERVTEIISSDGTKINAETFKPENYFYKKTAKKNQVPENVYYMMEDGHVLFTYSKYTEDEISIAIEGEETYYLIVKESN